MKKRLLLLDADEADALETVLSKIDPNTLAPTLDIEIEEAINICSKILTMYMQLIGRMSPESLKCKDCGSNSIGYDGSS